MARLGIGYGCLLLLAFSASSVVASSSDDDGGGVKLFELNRDDITVKLTNWGATLVSLILPDKNGSFASPESCLLQVSQRQLTSLPTYAGTSVATTLASFSTTTSNSLPVRLFRWITDHTCTKHSFRLQPVSIGSRINQIPGGYDINYVLVEAGKGKRLSPAAVVSDNVSGRRMEFWTNKPSV